MFPQLVEMVAFYELLGFSHVYLGVNERPNAARGGLSAAGGHQQTSHQLTLLLSRYINSGFVSVHPTANPHVQEEKGMLPFLNAVLYHSKVRPAIAQHPSPSRALPNPKP